MRNVGRGVARIEHFEISIMRTAESYAQHGGQALPVGEDMWLAGKPSAQSEFVQALQRQPSPLHEHMAVLFTVSYTDNSGTQRQRFEMGLGERGRSSAWRVLRTTNVRLDAESA